MSRADVHRIYIRICRSSPNWIIYGTVHSYTKARSTKRMCQFRVSLLGARFQGHFDNRDSAAPLCSRAYMEAPFAVLQREYSSQVTAQMLLWYLRTLTARLRSSEMRPLQPALRMALSMASILSQPCSSATSGRYVAENECFRTLRVATEDPDESGEGADDGEGETGMSDGCGNEM